MEDKKDLEIVQGKQEKKKTEWTPKRVLFTVIIAVLSLLMIGGLSYIIALVQQGTNDSNIFGEYNGEPIKYEANTVFYNNLNANADYQNALQNNDINGIYSAWYQAYQAQVVYTALNQMANKAGIRVPQKLVDELLISSGVYASEDGSKSFDEEVYKSQSAADRANTYQFYEKMYPYYQVIKDYQTVAVTDFEKSFVSDLSKQTRTFEYYVIDYNAYPDGLARDYDISGMTLNTDSEGKTVEPTLSEIKSYIYSKDAELVKPYIEASKDNAASSSFYLAASVYGNGVQSVENAVNNIGKSSYMFNDVSNMDETGTLAKVYNEALAKELYTSEIGHVTAPIAVDGGYIVVRVSSGKSDDSSTSLVDLMYDYYSSSQTMNSIAATVLTSDKFKDDFMTKFMPLIMGMANGAQTQQQ